MFVCYSRSPLDQETIIVVKICDGRVDDFDIQNIAFHQQLVKSQISAYVHRLKAIVKPPKVGARPFN